MFAIDVTAAFHSAYTCQGRVDAVYRALSVSQQMFDVGRNLERLREL